MITSRYRDIGTTMVPTLRVTCRLCDLRLSLLLTLRHRQSFCVSWIAEANLLTSLTAQHVMIIEHVLTRLTCHCIHIACAFGVYAVVSVWFQFMVQWLMTAR